MQCIIMENTLIKLTLHDETKKRAHDSQIVRAKENLKMSHDGSHTYQIYQGNCHPANMPIWVPYGLPIWGVQPGLACVPYGLAHMPVAQMGPI